MIGFKPYLGAGINHTKFSTSDIAKGTLTPDSSSWGGVLQVGVGVPLQAGVGIV